MTREEKVLKVPAEWRVGKGRIGSHTAVARGRQMTRVCVEASGRALRAPKKDTMYIVSVLAVPRKEQKKGQKKGREEYTQVPSTYLI